MNLGPGDEAAFTDFVAARWEALVRTGVFLGCDLHQAQDLAQVTVTKCLINWRKVRTARDLDGYVYGVLVNSLRDEQRRRSSTEVPTSVEIDGALEDVADQVVNIMVVHQALSSLPTDQRLALVLRYFADLTEDQVAAAMGVPTGTVKSRLSRARSALAGDTHLHALRKGHP